jgi:hypothetical protein
MGEKQNQPFQLSFIPSLRIDFQGSRVTSDGGLLLVRELDERLGFSALIAKNMMDDRRGKNTQLPLPDLLRQSIYSRLAGYEDVNDAERLSQDPTFRLIGSEKIWDRGAALPSRLHWFETEVLSQDENLEGLSRSNREMVAKPEVMDSLQRVVLDMDSTEIQSMENRSRVPTTGILSQPAITRCCCSTERETVLERCCGLATYTVPRAGKKCFCQKSSASNNWVRKWCFKPEIYEALEQREVKYAIRLPANDNLQRDIEELLTRPVGRPSHKPIVSYKGFLYQAASWKTARRVVAKVEFHAGKLFPRVGFIVTNLETPSRALVRFYKQAGDSGAMDQGRKQAVKMTHLSCHRFRSNQVRLALSLLAYNLGNLCRRLALPKRIESWSLTSPQQRLVKR